MQGTRNNVFRIDDFNGLHASDIDTLASMNNYFINKSKDIRGNNWITNNNIKHVPRTFSIYLSDFYKVNDEWWWMT